MKITEGCLSEATAKRALTSFSPSPTCREALNPEPWSEGEGEGGVRALNPGTHPFGGQGGGAEAEEGCGTFRGHGLGQQRLPVAGGPVQQEP